MIAWCQMIALLWYQPCLTFSQCLVCPPSEVEGEFTLALWLIGDFAWVPNAGCVRPLQGVWFNSGLDRMEDSMDLGIVKGKCIRFIVLYPPKCSHDIPSLAGLYTRTPFQSPAGYSRAVGSI